MILIATVWHSGTHSLMSDLNVDHAKRGEEWEQIHCCPEVTAMAHRYDIHTTLRDPYRVAAAWANRGRIHLSERIDKKWFLQWQELSNIINGAKVHNSLGHRLNVHEDTHDLHKALDDGDLEYYHRFVPKEWIDFVYSLPLGFQRAKFVETHSNERCSSK